MSLLACCKTLSHTSCRCVDWNVTVVLFQKTNIPHTSCRCVDWNIKTLPNSFIKLAHTSCRCVDWNDAVKTVICKTKLTPHVGVWIETEQIAAMAPLGINLTPHVGVWIETTLEHYFTNRVSLTPHVGVWIETTTPKLAKKFIAPHTSCRCVDWNWTL